MGDGSCSVPSGQEDAGRKTVVDSEPLLMTSAVQSQDPLVMEDKVVGGGGGVSQSCRSCLARRLWIWACRPVLCVPAGCPRESGWWLG